MTPDPISRMTALFWDIDGTLLTTAKAGVFAWEDAVLELTGRSFELASLRIAGLTDYQIAVKTFEALGISPSAEQVVSLVDRYGELLPSSLPRKKGHVLPNVREILESLQGHDGIRSYLLTGNTRAGATAKLTHYGLLQYFSSGAFAEDTRERSTIAERALQLARQDGDVAEEDLFVIGDTPHDVDCANAIGARTIAVATGGYSIEELEASQPWSVVAVLPSPAEFMTLLSRARGGARQRLPA
jgi:phosphoglycolate phosphatase-like HAD superfamily hydrolase